MTDPASIPPREAFEARQREYLAWYAVREADSGGRAHGEGEHPYRTCFQRDRDRVVHCSAFRRLDFKTQVFVPHEHDHFRTRMTHTLEVAQIARTLGRALRLNEDLAETVALAHDLGHPPFGHAGEAVLDELMADHGRFEHNRQSLRVVDYLEHPYPHFRGLNLTRVVRECLAKHRTRYDTPICDDFDTTLQPPLEGQLVDLADEIAYTSADLDDALGAGWVTAEQLMDFELWRQAWAQAERESPGARAIHKQIRSCKGVLAAMADDAIATTAGRCRVLQRGDWPVASDAVRRAGRPLAGFSDPMAQAVERIQRFLLHNVYTDPKAASREENAARTIRALFAAYQSDPALLPERYRRRIPADTLHRVICDYIAGMTDRYCTKEYERVRPGGSQKMT